MTNYRMIHKYQQWLEESEKIEAGTEAPAATPTETPTETPTDSSAELPTEEPSTEIETVESEIEQFRTLDTARKDAIKAFKAKQEEFLQIPDETRKNPVEETDKERIETLKAELVGLNQTMKAAIEAWNSFNSKVLGISDEAGLDDEP